MGLTGGETGDASQNDDGRSRLVALQTSAGSSTRNDTSRHRRHESLTSPPLPPPGFNPLPSFSDSPFSRVSPPWTSGSPAATSPTTSSESTIQSLPSASSVQSERPLDPETQQHAHRPDELRRPDLRALQQPSNDSITNPLSADSSSSALSSLTSGSGSEGGEHLAEMRERLLSEGTEGVNSGESSRRPSDAVGGMDSSESVSSLQTVAIHVTNPTPPMRPAILTEIALAQNETLYGDRRSPGIPHASDPEMADSAVHAWDSVWPAPGSAHRHFPSEQVAGPSRLPMAPLSPFVTPTFTPNPASSSPNSSRRPGSPSSSRISQSNRTPSPTTSSFPGRPHGSPTIPPQPSSANSSRRQSTAGLPDSPLFSHSASTVSAKAISRHHRTMSNSSNGSSGSHYRHQKEALGKASSPPDSPPGSPRATLLPRISDTSAPPSSPRSSWSHRNRPVTNPQTVGSERSEGSGASSTTSSMLSAGRPRGQSLSDDPLPPVVLIDPGPPRADSSQPDVSPCPRPDRHSETLSDIPPPDEDQLEQQSATFPHLSLPPPVVTPPSLTSPEHLLQNNADSEGPLDVSNLPKSQPTQLLLPLQPVPVAQSHAPLARPSGLRRAKSDYDPRNRPPPTLHRTLSMTPDLEKSPKRNTEIAALSSPLSPGEGRDTDTSRAKKSPRRSPSALPALTPLSISLPEDHVEEGTGLTSSAMADDEMTDAESPSVDSTAWNSWPPSIDAAGFVRGPEGVVVDEGDVLPTGDAPQMDVTFDDEGLNTLERIFLLSKSEYAFHRAYVARVLGDLLNDVDPCESVEYVLPLLSGFSVDEDESVKEAFASELHRILWYFYSTCKLVTDDGPVAVYEDENPRETVTITSEGVSVVDRPTAAEIAEIPTMSFPMGRRESNMSLGPSSTGSSLTQGASSTFSPRGDVDTPGSTISTSSSQGTAYSPAPFVNAYAEDTDPDKSLSKEPAQLVERPSLTVNFFTPLLGSLLLSQNPLIADPVRAGIVHVIGRLRSKGPYSAELWGSTVDQPEPDERRIFASQTGPHAHDLRPFTHIEKAAVENELVQGIVIGMGRLSTDMPDMLFGLGSPMHDEGHYQTSQDPEVRAEAEAFQAQLVLEATIGRATSMNLIGSVSEFYSGTEVVENGFVSEIIHAADGDVPVRAEAAIAMSALAKVAPVEHVYDMLEVFEHFSSDDIHHVRQSACLSLPALCRRIEALDHRRSFAIRSMQSLMESGDDVRCAALEMLGEVIYVFHDDPDGPPDELLAMFVDDSDGTEIGYPDSDWDVIASFNFPGVCLTLGPDRWHELRPLFHRLQARAGEKVTRTTALSIHELAKILRPDQIAQDIVPIYRHLLELNEDIREKVLENVDHLFSHIDVALAWDLFSTLADAWRSNTLGGWRAREKLAMHIPSFLRIFRQEEGLDEVLDLFGAALVDPFAAVRNAVTAGVPEVYEILIHGTEPAARFRDLLVNLCNSSSYRQRMTFVRCLREFIKPPPNRDAFEEFLLPELPRLSNDVVDVRLALAQLVADLFVVDAFYHNAQVPKSITQLTETLSQDDAIDVRDTVKHINLGVIGKGKTVPYEASAVLPHNDFITPSASVQALRFSFDDTNDTPSHEVDRRPSEEVSNRLGSMFLSPSQGGVESENESTPTPMVLSRYAGREEGGLTGPSQDSGSLNPDPFAVSFAEATLDEEGQSPG